METNSKIKISHKSPIHAGRIGYLQANSSDCAHDIILLSSQPIYEDSSLKKNSEIFYFGVKREFIEFLND